MAWYLNVLMDSLMNPKTFIFLLATYFRHYCGIKTYPLHVKTTPFDIGRSFIRWGDGETLMLLGISFSYENGSRKLSKKFESILQYSGNKFVLALPLFFIEKQEEETPHMKSWIITRRYFNQYLDLSRMYGDSFFFRNLAGIEAFKKLYAWKKLFLVSNAQTIEKAKKIPGLAFVGFQEIPQYKAYWKYDDTMDSIITKLSTIEKEDTIIIISAGPAAKVLAYDLTLQQEFVCHDVGSFFDAHLPSWNKDSDS